MMVAITVPGRPYPINGKLIKNGLSLIGEILMLAMARNPKKFIPIAPINEMIKV